MIRQITIFSFAIALLGGYTVAQSPSSSPSPMPAQRPTLDQFGLSNGVFAKGEPTAPTDGKTANTVEYVDQSTFDILNQLAEKSKFLALELTRALKENVDVSPPSRFRKIFAHHVEGIMHVSEAQRSGRFGGKGIKSGELSKLLVQNERTVFEILHVLDAGAAEYEQFSEELNGVSERYGVRLLDIPLAGTRLDKPVLLSAMMARLNGTFANIKRKMAVLK
jgi:hypothetical protein